MNEKRCIDFLLNIFYQSLLSESFFAAAVRLGVNFLFWPDRPYFAEAKKFYTQATQVGYSAALIETSVEIPDGSYREIIGEEEIKIFYVEYLNFLRSLELIKKLKLNPESATKLCSEFLESKPSTAQKINLSAAVSEFVVKNEEKLKTGKVDVVLSDFPCLSEMIGGFNPARVTIITAYTGFGKTNLGVNILRAAIRDDKSCLYVNMEMDTVDMTKRFLQATCHLRNYDFKQSDYVNKISVVIDMKKKLEKNWITDGSGLSISEISQMVSEIKRKQELDFLIVDYDQKIVMDASNIKEEWQSVKRAVELLEGLAKREQVHVVMFAQTNEDKDGAPIASRRSMQPASSVILFTKDGDDTVLKFIKNRHGSTKEKIKLNYEASQSLITEIGVKSEILPPPTVRGFKRPYADN